MIPATGPRVAGPTVFTKTRGQMCLVMLNRQDRQALGRSVARGAKLGVQVTGHMRGLVIEEISIVRIRLLKRLPGQRLVQLAQVMTQKGLAVFDQADRRLHLTAIGDDLGGIFEPRGQRQGARNAPARPAQDHRPLGRDPLDTVVETAGDIAVVHEKRVGEGPKLVPRLVVADDLRLARQVAGCHDQRCCQPIKQKVV